MIQLQASSVKRRNSRISTLRLHESQLSLALPNSSHDRGASKRLDASAANGREQSVWPPAHMPGVVTINVGGAIHQVRQDLLRQHPNSRLGRLASSRADEEVAALCDRYQRTGDREFYYFDRDPSAVCAVLNFYRAGKLHMPATVCPIQFEEELRFWAISPRYMEECCQRKLDAGLDEILQELDLDDDLLSPEQPEGGSEERFGPSRLDRARKFLWVLLEYPQSSLAAKLLMVLSVGFIVASTGTIVLNTVLDDKPQQPGSSAEQSVLAQVLQVVELMSIVWFTLEYLVRLACAPNRLRFLGAFMNLIDVAAILPYYLNLCVDWLQPITGVGFHKVSQLQKSLQVLRSLRVLRVVKLARHSVGLQALGHTLRASRRELGILLFFLCISVLIFSSLIYYAEYEDGLTDAPARVRKEPNKFTSIPASCWWAVVTMTTVGYGDMTPETYMGKVIGATCSVFGILVIGMPIPIIVSNFAEFLNQQRERERMKRMQAQAAAAELGLSPHLPRSASADGRLDASPCLPRRSPAPPAVHVSPSKERGGGGGHERETQPAPRLAVQCATPSLTGSNSSLHSLTPPAAAKCCNHQQNLSANLNALHVPTTEMVPCAPLASKRSLLSRDSSGESSVSIPLAPTRGKSALRQMGLRREPMSGIGFASSLSESSYTCPQIALLSVASNGASGENAGAGGGETEERADAGEGAGEVPKTNGFQHLALGLPDESTLSHSISF